MATGINAEKQLPPAQQMPQDFSEFGRSGINSIYLKDAGSLISQRTIQWEPYLNAKLITQAELDLIKKHFSGVVGPSSEAATEYIILLLSLLRKISRIDTLQFLLVRLDDYISSLPFSAATKVEPLKLDLFNVCSGMLQKEDEFTQLKTAKIIAELFCFYFRGKKEDSSLLAFLPQTMAWCMQQIEYFDQNGKFGASADMGLQIIQALLRIIPLRSQIFSYKSGEVLKVLARILRNNADAASPQMTYSVCSCLWLLSFISEASYDIHFKYSLIPTLLEVLRNAIKEKVVRITLLLIKNILANNKNVSAVSVTLIGNRAPALLTQLLSRKFTDEDINEDLNYLYDFLNKEAAKMSTWDEYLSEVKSGKLEWSPVHTSEQFWRQVVAKEGRFHEKDYEVLRHLTKILNGIAPTGMPVAASGSESLAVACFDIGQYVRHCPQGKRVVQELGAKQRIMELMSHDNAEVRYNALLAVQQYMSSSWEL